MANFPVHTSPRQSFEANRNRVSKASTYEADAQSESGATAGAEEPAPQVQEQSPKSDINSSHNALLAAAKESGHDLGDLVVQKEPEKPKDEPEPQTEPEPEPEPDTEQVSDPEQEKAAAEFRDHDISPKGSIAEKLEWYRNEGKRPPWYFRRINEQSGVLNERLETIERQNARIKTLESQVQQAQAPRPTEQNPLADVVSTQKLDELTNIYEEMFSFAKRNPNGAEDVPIGGGKTKDFTAEEVADIYDKADVMLRRNIPQRRQYLLQRAEADNEAFKIYPELKDRDVALEKYPELKDPNHQFTKSVLELIQGARVIEPMLGPEINKWIGRTLAGLHLELSKNGKPDDETTKKIVESAKTKIAPTPQKTRSLPERKGADIDSATKQLREKGDHASAEAWLAAKLAPKKGTIKRLEPVS